jgi:hypothetical protein
MVCAIIAAFLLLGTSMVQADVTLVTDQAQWEAMVTDIEVVATTAENIVLANEVMMAPLPDTDVGSALTFQSGIILDDGTMLTRGFTVETLEAGASFIFNDTSMEEPAPSLSVGLDNFFEDDDWELRLDNATMTAFGVEIRDSRNMVMESITLFLISDTEVVGTIDLNALADAVPREDLGTVFLGIVSDLPFDRILFDENVDTDNIAIADFRFAENPVACTIEPMEGRIIVDLASALPGLCSPTYVSAEGCLGELGPVSVTPLIPAGTYDVTLQSFDDHSVKGGQGQLDERYFLELQNPAGDITVDTNAIGDLPENFDNLIELVDTNLFVGDDIGSILAIHYCEVNDCTPNTNSVVPVCVAFDLVDKPCDPKDCHCDKDPCDGKDCYDGHDCYNGKDCYDGHDCYDGKDWCDGYDKDGYDKDGYNKDGYDKDGYHKDGYSGYGGYDSKDGYSGYGGYDSKDGYSGYGGYDSKDGYSSSSGW